MNTSTTKAVIYGTAVVLGWDSRHAQAEPHTHQGGKEGPPLHGRIGTPAANVAITQAVSATFRDFKGPVIVDHDDPFE